MKNVVRKPGEGEALWVLGMLMEIKVGSDETDGAMTIVEMTIPPGPVPISPRHTHPGPETVYILEGTVRYHVGEQTIDLPTGSQLHIAPNTWEWAENVTKQPARMLVTYTAKAADIHKFFREAGEVAKTRSVPPPSKTPLDFAKLAAIGKKYGMELQPPPRTTEGQQPTAR